MEMKLNSAGVDEIIEGGNRMAFRGGAAEPRLWLML